MLSSTTALLSSAWAPADPSMEHPPRRTVEADYRCEGVSDWTLNWNPPSVVAIYHDGETEDFAQSIIQ